MTVLDLNVIPDAMVVNGFDPYYRLVHADAPTECEGVIPAPWVMPFMLGFGAILLEGE